MAAEHMVEEEEENVDVENFFSDEDDKGMQAVEDLQSVIKRVSKKTANMIEAIRECQTRMDSNAQVIKKYIDEGRKPNKELRQQVLPLSDEFIRLAEIRLGAKGDVAQVYGQAQAEWQKQYQYISENKKMKNLDPNIKMKLKNDTEKIINKTINAGEKK